MIASKSFKDLYRYIKENFDGPYFVCSCALDGHIFYYTDEFFTSMQFIEALEYVFSACSEVCPGKDWNVSTFRIRFCWKEGETDSNICWMLYRKQYEDLDKNIHFLFEKIADTMKRQLFINLVNY